MVPKHASLPLRLTLCIFVFYFFLTARASDDCAPATWQPGEFERRQLSISTSSTSLFSSTGIASSVTSQPTGAVTISPIVTTGNITAGQVSCRYTGSTSGLDINYYTCTLLANKYQITVEMFFMLNPQVHPDCGNIQPDTDYCVRGFIEPVRAPPQGLCGPKNNNATCLGTAFQCCNSKTFTCGNSTEDCADGTCFSGACAGDSVYSTTGECGRQHGYKDCAGVWGDCCNADGKCGTGSDFCGFGKCQMGNCTIPPVVPGPPSWLNGNTTDGTCGGKNLFTCNVVYGNCCNKDGMCGALPQDCGIGCQSKWGTCSPSSTKTTASQTSSKLSSTTSTSTALSKTSVITTTVSPKPTSSIKSTTPATSSSTAKSTSPTNPSSTTKSSLRTSSTSSKSSTTSTPGQAALPSCGNTCFNAMLAQYSTLGCAARDSYCLCNNPNFTNGLRDCSNGACGTAIASTVISFGDAYCSTARATHTATGGALPSCGQTCFKNMLAQYSALGCASPQPTCLCKNANFGFGLRDCADGSCGTAVAATVVAYGSSYCASATAAH